MGGMASRPVKRNELAAAAADPIGKALEATNCQDAG